MYYSIGRLNKEIHNKKKNNGATSDETKSTTKKDIADTLGFTFNRNSSNRNCSEAFQNLKTHQEKVKLNFKSSNN